MSSRGSRNPNTSAAFSSYQQGPQDKRGGPVYYPKPSCYARTDSLPGYGCTSAICQVPHSSPGGASAEQTKQAFCFESFTGSPVNPFAASGSQCGASPTSMSHQPGLLSPSSAGCLSPQYPSDIELHSHLKFRITYTTPGAGLVWDVIHPPQVSKVVTTRGVVVEPDLRALATAGPVLLERLEMWTGHAILARYMRKWGPVVVHRSDPTVEAVLAAIHDYLHIALSQNDLQLICSSSENARLLETAREERARDGFELYEVAVKGPFRRSDVIGGHRRFQGIRAVKLEDGSHRLLFNLGPGPVPRY